MTTSGINSKRSCAISPSFVSGLFVHLKRTGCICNTSVKPWVKFLIFFFSCLSDVFMVLSVTQTPIHLLLELPNQNTLLLLLFVGIKLVSTDNGLELVSSMVSLPICSLSPISSFIHCKNICIAAISYSKGAVFIAVIIEFYNQVIVTC